MEIKVIQVFPTDIEQLNNIDIAKSKWFINILRKKYPENALKEAFKKLESNLKISKIKTQYFKK